VRHYTRLAHGNYAVDLGFYPLGSCTMKYNPKVAETGAEALELLARLEHALLRRRAGARWPEPPHPRPTGVFMFTGSMIINEPVWLVVPGQNPSHTGQLARARSNDGAVGVSDLLCKR
jgi:hypothetical protein